LRLEAGPIGHQYAARDRATTVLPVYSVTAARQPYRTGLLPTRAWAVTASM
jgi:hypothetical protein